MNTRMKNTQQLINRLRRDWVFTRTAEHLLALAVFSLALLFLVSLADALFHLHPVILRWYYYLVASGALLLITRNIVVLRKNIKNEECMLRFAQKQAPELSDCLLSAWQLSLHIPAGVSPMLVDRLIEESEASAAGIASSRLSPSKHWISVFSVWLACALCALLVLYAIPAGRMALQRVLSSAVHSSWQGWFSVTPGNGMCAANAPARVQVTGLRPLPGIPRLQVLTDDGSWITDEWSIRQDASYIKEFTSLPAGISYRIEWNNFLTPVFRLTPVFPATAGDFDVLYTYPSYTGLSPQKVTGNPHLSAPAGTKVALSARLSRQASQAKIITSFGTEIFGTLQRGRASWALTVTREGTYRIHLETEDGMSDPEPPEYTIRLLADRAPEVSIESPSADLVSAAHEDVPLIIQAQDDYGLSALHLVVKVNDRREERIRLATEAKPGLACTLEYRLPVSRYHLKAGDKVHYYAEARDNDTVAGGKTAASRAQSIEIVDFSTEHDAIEKDIQNIRNQLLNILADQTAAREIVAGLIVQYSTASFTSAVQRQKAIGNAMNAPVESLARVLERMGEDPYTDPTAFAEYRGIRAQCVFLRDTRMKQALLLLDKGEFPAAGKEQDEIIAALEKITLLAEDIGKYQRMRDVCEAGDQISTFSSQLLGPVANAEQAAELQKTLDQIQSLLEEIQKNLQKMPQELPEDFVNAPAVKSIDPQSAQNLAEQVRQSMAQGNYAEATARAKELYDRLQEMAKKLASAAAESGYAASSSADKGKEVKAFAGKLEKIIQQESSIVERTENLDRALKESAFAAQEKHFESLAARQGEQVRKAQALLAQVDQRSPELASLLRGNIGLMQKVFDEFTAARVYHAQKFLGDIVTQWRTFIERLAEKKKVLPDSFYTATERDSSAIQSAEEAILAELKKPPDPGTASAGDAGTLKKLGGEQKKLSDDVQSLRKAIDTFARESSVLPPETSAGMEQAAKEMQNAAREMEALKSAEALESARRALEHLGAAGEGLGSGAEQMDSSAQSAGKGPAIKEKSGGGFSGFRQAPVRIPTAEEYKVPRAFRQEIIEALKEKYPKEYDRLIQDYFRRLTR